MAASFNEEVQVESLFCQSLLELKRDGKHGISIPHLIDVYLRWSCCHGLSSKEELEIITAISQHWITIFGPMETLKLDEETGKRHWQIASCALAWVRGRGLRSQGKIAELRFVHLV